MSAAQKISRLALGYPEEPTLVVYRTREDTSQNYHIEGLPFGTRGGMLVHHLFPSDGEYTLTVTPIFGDNMSPAGFGSVPCERIEMLLDGERLQLMDWQGGGRMRAANCGRPARRHAAAERGATAASAAAEAFFGGRGGTPMRVRFKTTAGHAQGWRHVPGHELRAAARSRRHFMRSTVQTGPTPGYTFFPHVGTIRIEGPFNATQAADSPSRRKMFVCTPETRGRGNRLRAADRHQPGHHGVPPAGDGGRRRRPDGVLSSSAARRRTSTRASRWCWRACWRRRSSSTGSKRSRSALRAGSGVPHQPTSTWRRGCRSSCGARRPTRSCCGWRAQGRLNDPAVLEQQVRRMLQASEGERARGRTSPASG